MATNRLARLAKNATHLNRWYPDGKATLRAGTLRWVGELQPSAISANYQVEVTYRPPLQPIVYVRQPALVSNQNGELPHIYRDGSLCLYEPGQWSHADDLDETVIPWTCEWLLHYEFWLSTQNWHGSGGNHTGPVRPPDTMRSRQHARRRPQRSARK